MIDIKHCPQCKNDVKEGYIFSSRRISWSDSPESIFADYENEALSKDTFLKIKKLPAIRCEQCSLVLFKHEKI